MGEIADAMLDGTLCQQCGVYIEEGEAQGFPRYCSDCKPKNNKFHRKTDKYGIQHIKASFSTGDNAVRGVRNFLRGKSTKGNSLEVILGKYNESYIKILGYDSNKNQVELLCEEIQKDFGAFVKWFKETYK